MSYKVAVMETARELDYVWGELQSAGCIGVSRNFLTGQMEIQMREDAFFQLFSKYEIEPWEHEGSENEYHVKALNGDLIFFTLLTESEYQYYVQNADQAAT
ncbi:hypothetical protein HUG15_05575 [Salicibibacter cibarius]|uniref:Uncharacterized protein n=1 Tax=Salicibibacter cibarius TaxID=2743000 RepID=A0A7T7CAT8_9BACI|nr:hypothetical protein [Salicibibacter cibarius]QQK75064.1 hypothetical protein HUG15_05240 [Salicibibacter cibarius]QQK75126.1 hypothetical protein HUG15_05575 [Salicibibacter cibarius]